jgi:hypothetical protein
LSSAPWTPASILGTGPLDCTLGWPA